LIRTIVLVSIVALMPTTVNAESAQSSSRGTMTNAIEKVCAFLMEREQTASTAAQRFGMHLHDEGGAGITFTPRDHRFAHGSVGRRWESPTLNTLDLSVAKDATLTVGEMRAAFGRFERIDAEHFDQPPRWIGHYERPDRSLSCEITFQLVIGFLKNEPTDDLKIKTVTLIPQSKS
jgi:hypothetical protein